MKQYKNVDTWQEITWNRKDGQSSQLYIIGRFSIVWGSDSLLADSTLIPTGTLPGGKMVAK